MQKGLDFLLNKYSVQSTAQLVDDRTVRIDGKDVPMLPWRSERRFVELKKLVADGEINGISVMRTLRIVRKGADLWKEAYRELDLAQYILGSPICQIFAIGDGEHAVNLVAKTAAGYVCSFELSATLAESAPVIDKHEIIAISGVACDRAADTQVPQNSIYVFGGQEDAVYTDVDAELFGLNIDQCAVVRSAFELAKTHADLSDDAACLEKLVAAAQRSMVLCENICVEV